MGSPYVAIYIHIYKYGMLAQGDKTDCGKSLGVGQVHYESLLPPHPIIIWLQNITISINVLESANLICSPADSA